MENYFHIGDLVQLISGSPALAVLDTLVEPSLLVQVAWFNEFNELNTHWLPNAALKKVI